MVEQKTKNKYLSWFGGVFQPTVDFYALLNQQADKTIEGWDALLVWLKEDSPARCQRVRDIENEADELKLQLAVKLFSSFVTPFDREDIYELSTSLDEVMNGAKAIVREIEALEICPTSSSIGEMSQALYSGVQALRKSFYALRRNLKEATEQAMIARKADNHCARIYRVTIKELLSTDDFKMIFRISETYKTMLAVADRIDRVGEKLIHAIVKMS